MQFGMRLWVVGLGLSVSWVALAEEGAHPVGFNSPSVHGPATVEGKSDCRVCHGVNLEGSVENGIPSCDECHPAAWRTRCTFCHGGQDNESGAPLHVNGTRDVAFSRGTYTSATRTCAGISCHGSAEW